MIRARPLVPVPSVRAAFQLSTASDPLWKRSSVIVPMTAFWHMLLLDRQYRMAPFVTLESMG